MTDSDTELRSRAVSGAKWVALSRWASLLVTWPVTLAVARILSPSDFGLLAGVTFFTRLAGVVAEGGIAGTIVLGAPLSEEQYRRLHGWSISLFLLAAVLIAVLAVPIELLYAAPKIRLLVWALAPSLIVHGLTLVPTARLRRELEFSVLSRIHFARAVCESTTTLAFAWFGFGVWALVLGHLSGVVLQGAMTLHARGIRALPPTTKGIEQELRSSRHLLTESVSSFVANASDAVIGVRVAGVAQLGGYSYTKNLSEAFPNKTSEIVNYVSGAVLGSVGSDPSRLRGGIERLISVVAFFALPAVIGLIVLADLIVVGIVGPQWAPYVAAFRISCLAALLPSILNPLYNGSVAAGGSKTVANIGLLRLLMLPPSFVALGLSYGATGLAAAWILPTALGFVVLQRDLARKIGFTLRHLLRPLLPSIGRTVVMTFALLIAMSSSILRELNPLSQTGVLVIIGSATYALTAVTLFRADTLYLAGLLSPKLLPLLLRIPGVDASSKRVG